MKILLVSPLPPPIGGIATWTKLYLSEQKKTNNQIDLINNAKKVSNNKLCNLLFEINRNIKIITKIIWKITFNKYDVIHINSSCSSNGMIRENIIIKICKKKCPIIFECHCDVSNYVKKEKDKKRFNSICNNVNLILCLNSQSQKYIKEEFNKNAVIVSNFLNEKNIEKYDTVITEKVKKIIYVGRITEQKGCNEIIEVAKQFENIDFLFIGKLTEGFPEKRFKGNLKYLGVKTLDEVYQIMSESDVLLFPSYSEGFPITILESMFIGLPIITTKVGSIYDMLGDNGAVYIEIKNIDSIKKAINRIEDIKIRKNMKLNNRKKALDKYTIKKSVNEINYYYKELQK